MELLVGATGFVGGALLRSHSFSHSVHASDVVTAYDSRPDLCVYAGVPSEMYLANTEPKADLDVMRAAVQNIERIRPKKLVLVSTIAVYKDSRGKTEGEKPEKTGLAPYGFNRLMLENWVRDMYPDALVVRLPALYGVGLKKNFIRDLCTFTPPVLREEKYDQLSSESALVRDGYSLSKEGYYRLNGEIDAQLMKEYFSHADFNALRFTDSRSRFQFYNVARLWGDICTALDSGLQLLHTATPPVSAKEVYECATGKADWNNELSSAPYDYDFRSQYASLFGGEEEYFCSKEDELRDIVAFVRKWRM